MAQISTATPVSRHKQDSSLDCGRACAQMLIAHFAQSGASGGSAVAVTQSVLRTREPDPIDDPVNPSWYTHPDELQVLLDKAPELAASGMHWSVVSRTTFKSLSEIMLVALVEGMPSVVTTGASDHWMVLIAAEVTNDQLQYLQFLDPLPPLGQATAHTIVDNCGLGFDGETYVPVDVTKTKFGTFGFRVGSTPSPAGLTDYSDKFVGIVRVAAPSPGGGSAALPKVKKWLDKSQAAMIPGSLTDGLNALADRWKLRPLSQLVGPGASAPREVVRRVQNIDSPNDAAEYYELFTLRRQGLEFGLIGARAPDGSLLHFQFTTNQALLDSIAAGSLSDPLWWRRQSKTLSSPYYPYERLNIPGEAPQFKRLFDGAGLTQGRTPGDQKRDGRQ